MLSVIGESEEQHLVRFKGGDSSTQQQGNSIQNDNLGPAIHDLKVNIAIRFLLMVTWFPSIN